MKLSWNRQKRPLKHSVSLPTGSKDLPPYEIQPPVPRSRTSIAAVPEESVLIESCFRFTPSPISESTLDSSDESDDGVAPLWHSRTFVSTVRRYTRSLSGGSAGSAPGAEDPTQYRASPRTPSPVGHVEKLPLRKTRSESSSALLSGPRDDRSQVWEKRSPTRRCSETVINNFRKDTSPRRRFNSRTDNSTNEPIRPTARRAAVVSTLPDSDLSCLSDTIANMQRNQPVGPGADMKRSRWHFFKARDKGEMKLSEVLLRWKSKGPDRSLTNILHELESCKGSNRLHHNHQNPAELRNVSIKGSSSLMDGSSMFSSRERRRQDAVWELFTSERTYLTNHLLVLQQVFMEPLQVLQCDGYLLSVDVRSIFANLEEVCKVSLDFCRALLDVVGDNRSSNFGCADSIVNVFETFGSVMCPPYQRYCTGYTNSLTYRQELKTNEDYCFFLKWCERNRRCQRLKLNDFLVAPMQHLTKYPLLLRHIAQYTDDRSQNASIETTLFAVQESLKALEGKVTWLTHFQFLQDLQSSISWPPVYELDTKTSLPETLRQSLSQQPCRNLIANPKRQLVLDGSLSVIEQGRSIEIYALLFDDMMILARPKKGKRRTAEIPSSLKRHPVLKDGTLLTVYRQPVALDRFMVYDVETEQASSIGAKNAFVLVQENRFQQMTSVTMLQASTEETKRMWLTQLASTAAQWMEKHIYTQRVGVDDSRRCLESSSLDVVDSSNGKGQAPSATGGRAFRRQNGIDRNGTSISSDVSDSSNNSSNSLADVANVDRPP